MLFAACSNETVEGPQAPETNTGEVNFDTYISSTTRAVGGTTGVMTTSTLQSTGFGVFAYQTSNTYPAGGTGKTPNFMYNEEVTYGSSVWSYAPLKYWPNNTTQDQLGVPGHATTTTPNDYVSFFAYAPYVSSVGDPGITALTANDATGDPKVSYKVATKPSESVDLLWGVTPSAWTYTDVANNNWNSTGTKNFLPLKDMLKPDVQTRMKFLFLHALARLGVNVIAAVDQEAAGGELDANTKIVIESVTITESTATHNLATAGDLNLDNTAAGIALWENKTIPTAPSALTFTINASNELETSLLWESDAATSWAKEGVLTSKEKPLISANSYFMLIPTPNATNTDLDVNIVYHVITKDTSLDGDYSNVTNNITKKVTLDFNNGKAYTLKLILGLTSVKLDAEVKTWEVQGATDVDLPQNEE
ncbi:MAG: hypothetical protein J6W52_00485 [Bacteroidaceae bacterium]|nr:hypothetical protein [Bacteroidaceae bacterium]